MKFCNIKVHHPGEVEEIVEVNLDKIDCFRDICFGNKDMKLMCVNGEEFVLDYKEYFRVKKEILGDG